MRSTFRSVLRSFSFPVWSIPIALLALTLLSYGLRALSLGFFWDDWPYLWLYNRFGVEGITAAFAQDRPFLSFIYTLSLTALGSSSQSWQLFALFARWLCGAAFWWMLYLTWPRSAHKAAWAAALFIVYPGFTQQWIALIYGQAFVLFALLFISIGITLLLARSVIERPGFPRWLLAAGTLAALALSAFTMFSTEYFFGLELLRPVLLWIIFSNLAGLRAGAWSRLRSAALWWLPFLALMIVFVIWRAFIHVFPAASLSAIEGINRSPFDSVRILALTIIEDLVESSLVAWGQPLQLAGFIENGASTGLRLLAVILGAGALAFLYLGWLRPKSAAAMPEHSPHWTRSWAFQVSITGLIALLVGGWPFWVTMLPLRMGFPQDRYTLPLSVGVSLLLAGLIDTAGPNLKRKAAVLSLMLALAVGFHASTSLRYREDWSSLRSFLWQLTWRAPQIAPNTMILMEGTPFQFFEDDSLFGPVNWTYDPGGQSREMQYLPVDIRVKRESLPPLEPGQTVEKEYRGMLFTGSTSQTLVIDYDPRGCLHVLDPLNDSEIYTLPEHLQRAVPLSNPRALITENSQAAPPVEIFGEEPRYRWCYYYQKAELARQNGDWQAIVNLSQESTRQGLRPDDPSEYLPLIEGHLRLYLMEDALEFTRSALDGSSSLRPALCTIWRRTDAALSEGFTDYYKQQFNSLVECEIP